MLDRHARPSQDPLYAPLGLRGVGHVRMGPHTSRHGTEAKVPYRRLYWITEGAGFIRVDGATLPLRAGEVVLYGPGPRSLVWTDDQPMTYWVLACDGTAMAAVVDGLGLPRWPTRIKTDLSSAFAALGTSLSKFDRRAELASSKQLYTLLLSVAQSLADASTSSANAAWEVSVTRLMERSFHNASLGIRQVAADLGMHRSAFTRRFTAAIGQSPKVYLDRLRLNRAISLLSDPRLPMDEVALRSGFATGHGMAKVFHRLMGRQPGSFRRGRAD